MNEEGLKRVLQALAARDGLLDEAWMVGHDFQRDILFPCTDPGWIHGARRIGKTTLARDLMRRAERDGKTVFWADAIDLPPSLDALLNRWMRTEDENPQKRFQALVAASKKPVLAVADEMDRVVVAFGEAEQLFLRRLSQEQVHLSYLFVTALPPAHIVEHLAVEASRLLPIFHVVKLPMFQRVDVERLCERVSQAVELPAGVLDPEWIWRELGGFPVAVTAAIRYLLLEHVHHGPLGAAHHEELAYKLEGELGSDYAKAWDFLTPASRALLRGAQPSDVRVAEVKTDGIWDKGRIHIGRLMREAGERQEQARQQERSRAVGLSAAAEVVRLVDDINVELQARSAAAGFRVPSTAPDRMVQLSREPVTAEVFREGVRWLHQSLHEATRAGPRGTLLPQEIGDAFLRSRAIQWIGGLWARPFDEQILRQIVPDRTLETDRDRGTARALLVQEAIGALRTVLRQVQALPRARAEKPVPAPVSAPGSFEYDIALSFAEPERAFATELHRLLIEAGLKVFKYDEDRERWGQSIPQELDLVFRVKSRYCVAFLSKAYSERPYTRHELQSALDRKIQQDPVVYLLPIRVEPCDVPGIPPSIDFAPIAHSIARIATDLVKLVTGSPPTPGS